MEGARTVTGLQMPMVTRPRLPIRSARKLASFVADAVLAVLMRRDDLDEEIKCLVGDTVRRRIMEHSDSDMPKKATEPARADPASIAAEVKRLHNDGKLDDGRVASEPTGGNRLFVSHALVVKAGLAEAVVDRIAAARRAKAIDGLVVEDGFQYALCDQTTGALRQRAVEQNSAGPRRLLLPNVGRRYDLAARFLHELTDGGRINRRE